MPCRPLPAIREIVAAGEFSIAVIGRPLMDNVLGALGTVGSGGATGTTSVGVVGSGMGTACVCCGGFGGATTAGSSPFSSASVNAMTTCTRPKISSNRLSTNTCDVRFS